MCVFNHYCGQRVADNAGAFDGDKLDCHNVVNCQPREVEFIFDFLSARFVGLHFTVNGANPIVANVYV
jgi:hypothetical protein